MNEISNHRKLSSSTLSVWFSVWAAGFSWLRNGWWHHECGHAAQIFISQIIKWNVSHPQMYHCYDDDSTGECVKWKSSFKNVDAWYFVTGTQSLRVGSTLQPLMSITHKPHEWLRHTVHPSFYFLVSAMYSMALIGCILLLFYKTKAEGEGG